VSGLGERTYPDANELLISRWASPGCLHFLELVGVQKHDGTPKFQVWTSVLGREVLKDKCCSLTSQMLNH
jgi:hypothetical protein